MIPIRDTVHSRTTPIINWLLIAANALVFLIETTMTSGEMNRLVMTYGLVPDHLTADLILNPGPLITVFTHFFLHGGWFHLISNLWVLYIFGDNVEDRMGHARYLFFYLLSGVIAGLAQVVVMPDSPVPVIGASGAIAGVLGAYFLLFPRARVATFVPLFLFWFVDIPAWVFLGFWFFSQLFSGVLSLPYAGLTGGVGWWAHIGGFVFGALIYRLFLRRRRPVYYEYRPYDSPHNPEDWRR